MADSRVPITGVIRNPVDKAIDDLKRISDENRAKPVGTPPSPGYTFDTRPPEVKNQDPAVQLGNQFKGGKGGNFVSGGGGGGGGSSGSNLPPQQSFVTTPGVQTPAQATSDFARQQAELRRQLGLTAESSRSQEVRAFAGYNNELRKKAGTFGKDIGELEERRRIKEYLKEQESKPQQQSIQNTTQSSQQFTLKPSYAQSQQPQNSFTSNRLLPDAVRSAIQNTTPSYKRNSYIEQFDNPETYKDLGKTIGSVALGEGKIVLYAVDTASDVGNYLRAKATGKVYTGDEAVFTDLLKLDKNIYDYRKNPLQDVDFRNAVITDAFILAEARGGFAGGLIAKGTGTTFGIKSGIDFAKNPNPQTASQTILGALGTLPVIKEIGIKTSDIVKTIGADYVPVKEVGTMKFPLSSSVEESISRFRVAKEGNLLVGQTSTTVNPKVQDISVPGYKGSIGLEDPVIYITPKGEGSLQFLRISKEGAVPEYNINPFKGIVDSFKNKPNIIEIKYKEIAQLPKEIKETPGFYKVADYLESQKGSGKAFITKRSEIGQGSVKPQKFVVEKEFTSPFEGGQTVTRNGKVLKVTEVKKGDILIESGTKELEAGIYGDIIREPLSGFDKFRGFKRYTIVEGRVVPLREYKLQTGKDLATKSAKEISYNNKIAKAEIAKYEAETSTYLNPKSKPVNVLSNLYSSRSGSKSSNSGISSNVSKITYSNISRSSSPRSFLTSGISEGGSSIVTGSSSIPDVERNVSRIVNGSSSKVNLYSNSSGGSDIIIPGLPNQKFESNRFKLNNKKNNRLRQRAKAYSVLVKRRGKFSPIASNLPRGKALNLLSNALTKELARTGKIVESGITNEADISFSPSEKVFRGYKVRKGKRIDTPDQIIQRATANLKSFEEKFLIREAKRRKIK